MPQCLGSANSGVLLQSRKGACRETRRCLRVNAPVRDQKRTRAGVEERTREPREGFGAWLVTRSRVSAFSLSCATACREEPII